MGDYSSLFDKAFDDKPKKIEICFPSDEASQVCNERYELREGPKLYAHGDGKVFQVWSVKDEDYIEMSTADKPDLMAAMAKKLNAEWSVVLTMRFLILKIRTVFGVWTLTTRGEASSIPEIVSTFDMVKENAGTLAGIPFDLSVDKHKSQKPGSKNLFPVLKLVPNIGPEHQDMMRTLIESGEKIRGIVSPEVIESRTRLIEARPA